jgi:hypothetical protein
MYSSGGKSCNEEEIERLDREYNLFLLEELGHVGTELRDLKLFQRGFLQKFRNYLYGDWSRFYLLAAKTPLSTVQPWTIEVPTGCEILICCVDAAYWEVFVSSPVLLTRLRKTFAEAVPCRLGDKTT